MKTRWMHIVFSAVATACLTLNVARAAGTGAGAGNGPLQHILDAAKELNLTEDQKTKLKELAKEFAGSHDGAAMREKFKNNPELMATLKEMKAAKEAGDEAKMKELRQKLASTTGGAGGAGKGEGARGEIIQKLAAILTPEQMQKLKEMREAMAAKFAGGGAKGKSDSSTTDKAQKPDASKGVPNPFE